MFKRSLFLVLALFLTTNLFSPTPVQASTNEWYDKNYDFGNAKTILILEPVINPNIRGEIERRNILDIFFENAQLKNIKVLSKDYVYTLITADTGIDVREIARTDPAQANSLLNTYAKNYVDLILDTNLSRYESGSKYIDAHYKTETYYDYIYITNNKGEKVRVQKPMTRRVYVPGRNILTLSTYVTFKVVNPKTGEPVFMRSDGRYKEPNGLEKGSPMNMYKRALESFFKDFNKMLK